MSTDHCVCAQSFDDSGLLLIEVAAKNVKVMLFYGWGIYGQMVTQWFQWSFFLLEFMYTMCM